MLELTLAVADLNRFCHRRGDIDHRFSPSPTGEQGIAGHQRVYARRADSYHSEYPLEYQHAEEGLLLILRGRADGYDAAQGYVEEIKTCRVVPSSIPEAVTQMHLAQGRLYAALIARQEGLESLEVRLTWFNIDTDQEHSLSQSYSREELLQFLQAALAQFSAWLHTLADLRLTRDRSLHALSFPHGEFRRGQRALAELTYKCIDQAGQLLMEAPTGIGKTAAVLFPALKALASGKHDKVVFVTAKTVGRKAVEETLGLFAAAGYRGNTLSLTAREKICLSPGSACHGDECPYARGYYDKLPQAMHAAINAPGLRRQDIEMLARQYEVCPYQLALDLLPWVDVVIADSHYVYSLQALLGPLMQDAGQRWSVLLDEAHNLPDRARSMFSARLAKADLMRARQVADGAPVRALDKVNRQLLTLQKVSWQEQDFDCRDSLPAGLLLALQEFTSAVAQQIVIEPAYLQQRPGCLEFFFDVLQFLRVAENWGQEYRLELTRDSGKQSLVVSLNCMDPSRLLSIGQLRAHSVSAFSATLSPMEWTRASLGLARETVCHRAESPFSGEQLQVRLITDIDTRYRQRERTLPLLVQRLLRWIRQEPGNCIVYFPSYRYLNDCLQAMQSQTADLGLSGRLWVQRPNLDEAAREELLQMLGEHRDVLALCILGGIFGEGIDLPGEQLSSIVVVGVGMPQVNRQTRQLQQWYEQSNAPGFAYAYLYPGMQKVDQALGRVVRSSTDRGKALLIDPRYRERQYRELLPPWWQYQDGD